MDLQTQINGKLAELSTAVNNLSQNSKTYAKCYQKYRIMLSKELLFLKDSGMAVTLAYDVARGKEEIAQAKFEEISSEALYRANLESINAIKLEIKVLEEQINREWGSAKNE